VARIVHVDDLADPRLADYVGLRDVQMRLAHESEHGIYLAEGEKVVRRAHEAGHRAASFLMAPRWLDGLADVLDASDAPCFVMTEKQVEQVTGFHVHRGALAAVQRPAPVPVDDVLATARRVVVLEDLVDHTNVGSEFLRVAKSSTRIAVFEDIVDHTNLGAGFRAAAALGIDAVLLSPRCADPLYRRAIKTSMGAVFQIPYARFTSWPDGIKRLKDDGYHVAGMALTDESITLDELASARHPKLALMFGTEGRGLWWKSAQLADSIVRIPMSGGIDSLNVASAAAIAFYATRPSEAD
jgi:tRNA G18 (ribose-2'-O)-methylase SpoU